MNNFFSNKQNAIAILSNTTSSQDESENVDEVKEDNLDNVFFGKKDQKVLDQTKRRQSLMALDNIQKRFKNTF